MIFPASAMFLLSFSPFPFIFFIFFPVCVCHGARLGTPVGEFVSCRHLLKEIFVVLRCSFAEL